MIWVIVDRFSKQAHFIPCLKTLKGHAIARLFIKYVFVHHGLLAKIVSDRDPRLNRNFYQALFENLDTTLKFSSAYHPWTEIVNLTLLDMLKAHLHDQEFASERFLHLYLKALLYLNHTLKPYPLLPRRWTDRRAAPFETEHHSGGNSNAWRNHGLGTRSIHHRTIQMVSSGL